MHSSESDRVGDEFVKSLNEEKLSYFKFHPLKVSTTVRFWSAVSKDNDGVMKRTGNIVKCDGQFHKPIESK